MFFLPWFIRACPEEEPVRKRESHRAAGLPGQWHNLSWSRGNSVAALQHHHLTSPHPLRKHHTDVHTDTQSFCLCAGTFPRHIHNSLFSLLLSEKSAGSQVNHKHVFLNADVCITRVIGRCNYSSSAYWLLFRSFNGIKSSETSEALCPSDHQTLRRAHKQIHRAFSLSSNGSI